MKEAINEAADFIKMIINSYKFCACFHRSQFAAPLPSSDFDVVPLYLKPVSQLPAF